MPSSHEIVERSIYTFRRIQKRMMLAREEGAVKTYEDLKDEYISLKAVLISFGVNLTELDIIKE